jgi:hypothetical protein
MNNRTDFYYCQKSEEQYFYEIQYINDLSRYIWSKYVYQKRNLFESIPTEFEVLGMPLFEIKNLFVLGNH